MPETDNLEKKRYRRVLAWVLLVTNLAILSVIVVFLLHYAPILKELTEDMGLRFPGPTACLVDYRWIASPAYTLIGLVPIIGVHRSRSARKNLFGLVVLFVQLCLLTGMLASVYMPGMCCGPQSPGARSQSQVAAGR